MHNRSESQLYVETNYRVLYEDASFLVVDKPAPLPVHKVGRFKEKNLLSLIKKEYPSLQGELRIINRLDSETSGLVIVAKSQEAAGKLGILFEKREVHKEYEALVLGVPDPKAGSITTCLGTTIQQGHRMRTPDPKGEEARTDYEVLKVLGNTSLVKIVPRTGRMHQIRAHLSFMGHPIVGDKIYIDPTIFDRYVREGWQEDMRATVGAERLQLHAARLRFQHPETGEVVQFDSAMTSIG